MRGPAGRSLHADERGVALVTAIVLMVIAALVIMAISVMDRGAADRAKDARERTLGSAAVDEGVTAYTRALTSGTVGEHTGFVFTLSAIQRYVREVPGGGGVCSGNNPLCYYPNAQLPAAMAQFRTVDNTYIPGSGPLNGRVTVRRRTAADTYGYWQLYSIVQPRYGLRTTARGILAPGGRVVVYFRGWSTDARGSLRTKPMLVRAEVRPTMFSDYQVVADGKMRFGQGATLSGAVHSNGFDQSWNDQYRGQSETIWLDPTDVTCTSTARITTRTGPINSDAPQACRDRTTTDTGQQVNMLRAAERAAFYRRLCQTPANQLAVRVVCFQGPGQTPQRYNVRLTSTGQVIVGGRSIDARNTFVRALWGTPWNGSGRSFGAVVVFDRSINLSGTLGNDGRATLVVNNPNPGNLLEQPAIVLRTAGAVGKSSSTTSAGMISDTDVIAIESSACPLTIRGALVATGGMLSMDPEYRGLPVAGDTPCDRRMIMQGSVAGHLPPYMVRNDLQAGYLDRTYRYDQDLYDNPPPLYPTTAPWEVIRYTDASFDCFTRAQPPRLRDVEGCT